MSCVVEGCKAHSSRKPNEDESLTFHRFPNDDEMKTKWIQCINRFNWTPKKHSRICSKHFSEDSFLPNDNTKWRRLKSGAVPIVNIPETCSFVVKTEVNDSLAEPTTSSQHQNIIEPLTEIKIENTSINLKREISSFDCSTSADTDKIETTSEKKIRLLKKQVEHLKNISKRRLRRINTLTKRITRLTKKNVDLYTVLLDKFKTRKYRKEKNYHVG